MTARPGVPSLLLVAVAAGPVLLAGPGLAQGPVRIDASLSLTGTYLAPAQP